MNFLYNLIFYLLLPFIFIRALIRSKHSPLYRRRFLERLGFYADEKKFSELIWVHAVSLGESKLAVNLISELHKKFPELRFVVTTMTLTGSQEIVKELGDKVIHVYVPYDFYGAVKRFLKHFNPKLLVLLETEIWPNMLLQCGKTNIPIILANARLSENSARGYQRIKFFIAKYLEYLTLILAQTLQDKERFVQIGVSEEKIKVLGNLKFDLHINEKVKRDAQIWREKLKQKKLIFIAGSTHEVEEEIILQAWKIIREKFPEVLLILAPRHPERFDAVAKLIKEHQFTMQRYTQQDDNNADVFLLDTMGELNTFYAASDVAFVGGSLIDRGGHNLLEPAALALPIISGAYLEHFLEIAGKLKQQQALFIVHNVEELAATVVELFADKNLRDEYGMRAHEVALRGQDALERTCEEIARMLSQPVVPRLDRGIQA